MKANEIEKVIIKVTNNFIKIGLSPKINISKVVIQENFYSKSIEFSPFFVEPKEKTLYVDTTAAEEINPFVLENYLVYEIAHNIANNGDHKDPKFIEAINKYNSTYKTKAVAEPSDEYNKRCLPCFSYKIDELDKLDSKEGSFDDKIKDFSKRIKNGEFKVDNIKSILDNNKKKPKKVFSYNKENKSFFGY